MGSGAFAESEVDEPHQSQRAGSAADVEAQDPEGGAGESRSLAEMRWESKRCILKMNGQEGGGKSKTGTRSYLRTEEDGSGETESEEGDEEEKGA